MLARTNNMHALWRPPHMLPAFKLTVAPFCSSSGDAGVPERKWYSVRYIFASKYIGALSFPTGHNDHVITYHPASCMTDSRQVAGSKLVCTAYVMTHRLHPIIPSQVTAGVRLKRDQTTRPEDEGLALAREVGSETDLIDKAVLTVGNLTDRSLAASRRGLTCL